MSLTDREIEQLVAHLGWMTRSANRDLLQKKRDLFHAEEEAVIGTEASYEDGGWLPGFLVLTTHRLVWLKERLLSSDLGHAIPVEDIHRVEFSENWGDDEMTVHGPQGATRFQSTEDMLATVAQKTRERARSGPPAQDPEPTLQQDETGTESWESVSPPGRDPASEQTGGSPSVDDGADGDEDVTEKLERLWELHEKGAISKEEYEEMKAELLDG